MKKTKIVCTLGPATDSEEILSAMADAGMNVARINFSHGTHEEHAKKIAMIKKVRQKKNIALPILLDTKGPEFRIKTFENGKIFLKEGNTFTFTTEDVTGNAERVAVSYAGICEDLFPGDKILLNNGLMVFEVKEVKKPDVVCTVLIGGELSNRKSMFFPEKELHLTYLSEQDKADLLFGIEQNVDFVACSFVSKAQDILDVRNFLHEHGSDDIDLIAKIENRTGVNHLQEILDVSDGIMIGRGDMGVEIPYEELPDIQKTIITACRIAGKRCITATEMLESMIKNPRPTSAEISDVANAVYDGSSAVMLSGETAAGAYPVEAVKAMAKIAMRAESKQSFIQAVDDSEFLIRGLSDALSHSACLLARDVCAKAIVVCTRTGNTAKMVSRFRPMIDIIGMTTDPRSYQKLALSWGVLPALSEEYHSVDVLFHFAKQAAKDSGLVGKNDVIVITGGTPNGKSGNSNLINIETV